MLKFAYRLPHQYAVEGAPDKRLIHIATCRVQELSRSARHWKKKEAKKMAAFRVVRDLNAREAAYQDVLEKYSCVSGVKALNTRPSSPSLSTVQQAVASLPSLPLVDDPPSLEAMDQDPTPDDHIQACQLIFN